MSTNKQQFLQRIRDAVAEGNRAAGAVPLPERGDVGYQGAGQDSVGRFCDELSAAGGVAHVVDNENAAVQTIEKLVDERGGRKVLLGRGRFLDALHLNSALDAERVEILRAEEYDSDHRDEMFSADIGISSVDFLIAETGSILVASKPNDPRSVSLLPPVHIAVAHKEQILPDLFDLFTHLQTTGFNSLSSGMAVITGPSKTGDIELKLVTGVHGPGEVHVILITG